MAEGGGLLNRYTGQNLYRGFESPPLRQRAPFLDLLAAYLVAKLALSSLATDPRETIHLAG